MDLNLTRQFLAGFGSNKVGFGYNFESPSSVSVLFSLDGFDSLDLITLSKTTFTKESAALISHGLSWFVMVFWADWLDFLFDNLNSRWHIC